MAIMNKYEWVFFDFDGTLIDSIDSLYSTYLEFLKKYNISGSIEEFTNLNGPNIDQIVSFLKKKYDLTETDDELLSKYYNIIEEKYLTNVKPFEGRTQLLNYLKNNNYKIALITSASKLLVEKYLIKHKWIYFFDLIICGDDFTKSKPNPEIYLHGLKKVHTNKKNILVFEDSENGFQSAQKAGLNCILVKNKSPTELLSIFQ